MRKAVSSSVPRRDREQRPPRNSIEDFTRQEQDVIDVVHQWFPGSLVVIGSRARGNWAEDSDIDIGVVDYKYSSHKSVVEYINKAMPIKVDLFKMEHALTHNSVVWVYE